MSEGIKRFRYGAPLIQPIAALGIMGGLSYALGHIAIENEKGLRIKFLTLTASEASLIYWGFCFVLAFLALGFLVGTLKNMRMEHVELNETHAVVPKASMLGGQLNIPYESIRNISRNKLNGRNEMLVIKSDIGESRLISSHFKKTLGFIDFIEALNGQITKTATHSTEL